MTEFILYRYWGADDELLYVGVSLHAMARMAQHQSNAEWWSMTVKVTFDRVESREALYQEEARVIREEHPLYNKPHRSTQQVWTGVPGPRTLNQAERIIRNMRADGATYLQVVEFLNDNGVRTRTGKHWTRANLQNAIDRIRIST